MLSWASASSSTSSASPRCLSQQWFYLKALLARKHVGRWNLGTRIRHRPSSWRCNRVWDLSALALGTPVSKKSERFLSKPGSLHHRWTRSNSQQLGHFASVQCLKKRSVCLLWRLKLRRLVKAGLSCMRWMTLPSCKAGLAPVLLLPLLGTDSSFQGFSHTA